MVIALCDGATCKAVDGWTGRRLMCESSMKSLRASMDRVEGSNASLGGEVAVSLLYECVGDIARVSYL